jgi:sRNA-binding protein
MSRCIALVPTRASAPAWHRCLRRARSGDRFCAHHRHALDGAVMGLLHSKEHRHAQEKSVAQERRRALRKRKRFRRRLARLARQARKEARKEKRRDACEKKPILARYGRKNPVHALAAFFGE